MLKQIGLQISFTKEERRKIQKKYHFEERDSQRFDWMVELLGSVVRAKAWYRICREKEIEELPCSCYAAVIVTLSEYSDRLIALESEAGNLLDAYMLDCIALEFLQKAYRQTAQQIYQETQLWQGERYFFGEQLPLEYLPSILETFPNIPVQLNSSGMIIPIKSVIYFAELVEEPEEGMDDICFACKNQECIYRKEQK